MQYYKKKLFEIITHYSCLRELMFSPLFVIHCTLNKRFVILKEIYMHGDRDFLLLS